MKVLDLFSAAAGGWSLGLHRAGFQTIAACEVVPWRRALYAENNPGVLIYDDVRTLTASRLQADLGTLPDIIVGSPPCQDISSANVNGVGVDGAGSGLFFEAARVIGDVRPRWFALENSDRIRSRGYDRVAAELEAIGYSCWPIVVGVGNVGGSHKRKRAWIIGMDADAPLAQGRAPGQPRVDADADRPGWPLPGPGRGRRVGGEEAGGGAGEPVVDAGSGPVAAGLARVFRGPVGSADLGCHLRAYDGVPSGLAEQCREAYGDAVCPQIPELIGRAILRTESALAMVTA